jgi:hypothetical protein
MQGLFWLVKLLFHKGVLERTETILYFITSLVSFFLYSSLRKMGVPTYGLKGELLKEGFDLSSPGIIEYMLDIIYVIWAAQILSLFSFYGWWVLAIVPSYMGYYALRQLYLYYPWSSSSVSQTSGQNTSKRQEKREAKGDKVRYKMAR